jgi:hypothetical protein
MKAQSSIEFLIFSSIAIFFLVSAVSFFGLRSAEVEEIKRLDEMESICQHVSSKIAFVYSGENGTQTTLDIPNHVIGKNISIFAFADSSNIIVRDSERSVGCNLNVGSITNGSASSFEISKNATIANNDGVVVIG